MFAGHAFVGTPAHGGMRDQRLGFGRAQKHVWPAVVEERLDPQDVAGAEELTPPGVPERKCEVAEQPRRARVTPAAVRTERKRGVGAGVQHHALARERLLELVPVVQAAVEHDGQARVRRMEWLLLPNRFGRRRQQAVPECDGAGRPHPRRVGSAVRNRPQHACHDSLVSRESIEIEHCDETAQDAGPA